MGSRKLHIYPKVIKMRSIFGHRIDYNGVGVLRGQRHIPNLSKVTPPPTRGGQSSEFTYINKGNLHYELRNSFF